jgi:16S rRNA (cytidine1402-2'-O)-methyltransferase
VSAPGESAVLWIVATPIGALDDLSPRAIHVFSEVDVILAEDTRRSRNLLTRFGISVRGRLRSLHEHNEDQQVPKSIEMLNEGRSIALMSDAGTPVLSDPGYPLIRAARQAGIRVCSVPGPSSFTAALAASGQPPLPATLCGFLPARAGSRRRRIAELGEIPFTLIVLLSPHRLARELADLAAVLGEEREATLLAELSKVHERAVVAPLGELARGSEAESPRGEYILVIGPPVARTDGAAASAAEVFEAYRRAVSQGLDRREAMRQVARQFGMRKREVFDVLVEADQHADTDGS